MSLRFFPTPTARPSAAILHRKCACQPSKGHCPEWCKKREKLLHRSATRPERSAVPPIVGKVLHAPGVALDAATRAAMELPFRWDFSQVRVHADSEAGRSAEAVHAAAYTAGRHIVFAPGEYAPHTARGQKLLAHELAHVVQQGSMDDFSALKFADPSHAQELAAEQAAERIMHGFSRAELPQGGPDAEALQRQPAGEEEELGGEAKPIWHMLSPPPAIKQHSLTCWAAALASWLEAKGADKKTFQDVILEYVGTSCIDPQNALPFSNAPAVFAEWGAVFQNFSVPGSLTFDVLKKLLQQHGHLLLALTGSSLGHTLVVYGVGIDDKGMPNPGFMSVMDPLIGKHENRPIAALAYPLEIGHLATRVRPAACRKTPGQVPAD